MAITIPLITEFKDKGLKEAESRFDSFNRSASKAFGGLLDLTKKVAIGAAGLATAAGFGAGKAIGAASDLSEELSKAGELFGDTAGEVDDFARVAARRLGQSRKDAIAAANTFAIFGKAAGLAGQDLLGFSTDFVALASDLASFNNTSPEDAVQAIGAALRGESEPLRRYGVLLDDASLRQQALTMGIYDGVGALTQQQKIRAAEILIYKQTQTAQGDFERTSEGLANTQRILRAELANVTTQIGEKLLPMALQLAQFFSERIMPAVQTLADAFSQRGLGGVIELLATNIRYHAPRMREALIGFLEDAGRWIMNTGIPMLVDVLGKAGQALVDWIGPRIRPMLEALGGFIAAGANWVIHEGLPKLVDALVRMGNALVDWIKPRIAPAIVELGNLLAAILRWIVTDALPAIIPQLAKLGWAMVNWIIDIIPEVVKGLGRLYYQIGSWFINDAIPGVALWALNLGIRLVDAIGDGIRAFPEKMVQFGKDIVRNIVRGIQAVGGEIAQAIFNLIPGPSTFARGISSIGRTLGNVVPFADGGIVTKPTLGLVGEAGPEAIIPLNQMRNMGGGGDINITVTSADPQAVIEAIRTYNRQQGPAPILVA